MATRESRELVKREPSRGVTPLEEMENLFEEMWRRPFSMLGPSPWFPRLRTTGVEEVPISLDMYEEGDQVVVKAEVPGLKKEEIEVNFSEDVLTITGEKRKEEKVENKDYYRLERSYGTFSRSIRLPFDVQSDKASASFKDGVLEVRVPKSEESKQKTRKITIQ